MTRIDRSNPFETLPDGTYRFESPAYRANRAAEDAETSIPRWARCQSTYPGAATLRGRAIRCELADLHDGKHGHSLRLLTAATPSARMAGAGTNGTKGRYENDPHSR